MTAAGFVVGMALDRNKARKHVSDKLVHQAAQAGVTLVALNMDLPIADQGKLDVILQKVRKREWEEELERYLQSHPNVRVIDPPHATYPLRNRGLMLAPFSGPGWVCEAPLPVGAVNGSDGIAAVPHIRCCVPAWCVLEAGTELAAARMQLAIAGLKYPMLAKSLWADGRDGSHSIAALFSEEGLRKLLKGEAPNGLAAPVLVQGYVDHGTCLFKVYVLGGEALRVSRPSLHLTAHAAPAIPECHASPGGIQTCSDAACDRLRSSLQTPAMRSINGAEDRPLVPGDGASAMPLCDTAAMGPPADLELVSRISAYPAASSWGNGDLAPPGHGVPVPPDWLCQQVAQRVRSQLGLNLFNFDLIVPLFPPLGQRGMLLGAAMRASGADMDGALARSVQVQEEGLVHLIDINYFPGYEKLPGYEETMVRFLCRLRAGGS